MTKYTGKALLYKMFFGVKANARLWPGLAVITIGIVMFLFCVVVYASYNDMLAGKYDKSNLGSSYLTLSKKIPGEKLAEQKMNLFSANEMKAIKSFPGVEDVGVYNTAKFPVEVLFRGGDTLSFSSDIFIEAVPDRFIDNKPIDWYWQYDSPTVPVIVSKEFLNLYNFGFAPNEQVPQLTPGTLKSLTFHFRLGDSTSELFSAKVVGFSDRISSIIVPQSFIDFGHKLYTPGNVYAPARIIIKVKDPSDEKLKKFIDERDYDTNNELTRWNRLRAIMNTVNMALLMVAIALLVVGVFVFLFFVQLTLVKFRPHLQNLVAIGYNPAFLRRYIAVRYTAMLLLSVVVAGVAITIIQVRLAKYLHGYDLMLNTFPSWQVWVGLLLIFVSAVVWVIHSVSKMVR